jgi:hypothetical protein
VERFFGLLMEQRFRRGTSGSVREPESAIRAHLTHHKQDPKTLTSTADVDSTLKKIARFYPRTSDSGRRLLRRRSNRMRMMERIDEKECPE